ERSNHDCKHQSRSPHHEPFHRHFTRKFADRARASATERDQQQECPRALLGVAARPPSQRSAPSTYAEIHAQRVRTPRSGMMRGRPCDREDRAGHGGLMEPEVVRALVTGEDYVWRSSMQKLAPSLALLALASGCGDSDSSAGGATDAAQDAAAASDAPA